MTDPPVSDSGAAPPPTPRPDLPPRPTVTGPAGPYQTEPIDEAPVPFAPRWVTWVACGALAAGAGPVLDLLEQPRRRIRAVGDYKEPPG